MVRDMTSGSVFKSLMVFAFPLFLSNLLQAVYNVVDMIVVGRVLGSVGMSAVSIGGDLMHLLTFVAMGFSSAGQIIISQYVGAGMKDRLQKLIGTIFTFMFFAALTVGGCCLLLRVPLLNWLNTPEQSYADAMSYLVTCCCGIFFIYGYNVVSAILRGMGDSKRPFVFIAIAAILNTVLDITFVGVMGMGVFGAALATVIGQAVSFVASLIYLIRNKEAFGFDFKFTSFRIDKEILAHLIKLGIPMTMQSAAIEFSKLYVTAWINSYGVAYSAMSGAANKIRSIGGLAANAFNAAGSTMIGQNVGAEKWDRVKQIVYSLTLIAMFLAVSLSVIFWLYPQQLVGMFTDDTAVLALAVVYVPCAIVNFLGIGTRAPSFALINGTGFSKLNLTVGMLDGLIGRLSLAYLLGFTLDMGAYGVWMGDALAGLIPGTIGLAYFLSGKWKTRKYIIDPARKR